MQINTLFKTGSKDLKKYLEKHKEGSEVQAGTIKYKVREIDVDDDIPANFDTGEAQTKVTLTLALAK